MATILVVEDESLLLGLICSVLRLDGHTIIEASDPLDALALANAGRASIDLVFTDITMKPISGLELTRRLRQGGIDIPVLFMSGYPSIASAITVGGQNFTVLDKPFSAAELRRTVKTYLTKNCAVPPTSVRAFLRNRAAQPTLPKVSSPGNSQ